MENQEKGNAVEAYAKAILDAYNNAPLSTELNFFQLKEIALISCKLMYESHPPQATARIFLAKVYQKLAML